MDNPLCSRGKPDTHHMITIFQTCNNTQSKQISYFQSIFRMENFCIINVYAIRRERTIYNIKYIQIDITSFLTLIKYIL